MSARARRPSRTDVLEEYRTGSIHEAALRVISRTGVAAATMADVAAEAGVSRATLYLYFKDRNELVERTAAMVVAKLIGELQAALARPGTTAERLRAHVATQVRFFHDHRQFFRLFLEACGGEERRTKHRKHYEQHLAVLAAVLAEGMEKGEVRRADPRRAAVFVAEAVGGIVRQRLAEQSSPDPGVEADWIATALLRGLAEEPNP